MITDYSAALCVFDGDLKQKNYWVYGPTGCGKSKWITSQADLDEICDITTTWKFYDPSKHFLWYQVPSKPSLRMRDILLHCGDRYPFTKDGKLIQPSKFFFLVEAYYPIEHYFKDQKVVNQIKRWFTEVNMENNEEFSQFKLDKSVLQ